MSSQDIFKRYLLGELTLGEQEELEQRFLLDPDFFEEAVIVEMELVDSYLEGSLSNEEKESFVEHFLATTQQVQKLKTGAAFRRYMSETGHEEIEGSADRATLKSWLRAFSWRIRTRWSHAA